jgi:hypothetical protein
MGSNLGGGGGGGVGGGGGGGEVANSNKREDIRLVIRNPFPVSLEMLVFVLIFILT